MAIDISNLAVDESTVTVKFAGGEAIVTYKLSAITARHLTEIEESDNEAKAMTEFLVGAIKSWDIMKGKKPLEITAENIAIMPLHLLRAIVQEIMGDSAEGEAPGNSDVG